MRERADRSRIGSWCARTACLAALLTAPLTGGCADVRVITTARASALSSLPAVGFNHTYGLNPVASLDASRIQRNFFATGAYWEAALVTQPQQVGFVKLSDTSAVRAARHRVNQLILTVASEDRNTLRGMLNYPGGPEHYARQLLDVLTKMGYDALSGAQVRIFFSESYEYGHLSYTRTGGSTWTVLLKIGRAVPGGKPLPAPTVPPGH